MRNIIVAYDANRGIGSNGQLPWKRGELQTDMQLFRKITMGGTVIMGHKTMEYIGKPLAGRRNIVLTKNGDFVCDGVEIANSLDEAFKISRDEPEVFVIGGAEVYSQTIDKVDRIFATELPDVLDGVDTYFPDFDKSQWFESNRRHYKSDGINDKYSFDTVIYGRKTVFVNLDNARFEDQKKVMEDIVDDGVCPFCEEHLTKYHKQEILRSGEHWLLTYNQWPYDNTTLHLLAIAKYHAVHLSDMKPGAAEELFDLLRWAETNFAISFGGVCMRFGDTKKTGATVDHLHAHFIVPEENLPKDKKVRFKVS